MAYRRSLSIRATLLVRRLKPSFGYIPHENDREMHIEQSHSQSRPNVDSYFLQRRTFGACTNISFTSSIWPSNIGSCNRMVDSPFHPGLGLATCFNRFMTTSIGKESEYVRDVSSIVSDAPVTVETIASQAHNMSEVAGAAADSAFPVAALQHLIDGVHSFTGFNWWASIALTALLIRLVAIPLTINQLKASSKLALIRPRLDAIKEKMQATGMDPHAVAEGQKQIKAIFNEYGVTPLTPLKGLLIQGPIFISFFLAISNMTEKVPSFKTGGALWFTDLTTPDSLYIFPILAGVTFLAISELNMQEGLEGNPVSGTMKKFTRAVGVLTVPFTMSFPKAIFFYWITSNLFSLAYGSVLRVRGVKKFLGVPDIPVSPPCTGTTSKSPSSQQKGFSLLQSLKQASSSSSSTRTASEQHSKSLDQKISPPSAAISHQIVKIKKRRKSGKKK